MPELPEVETVRRTLMPAVGMRVTEVWTSGLPLRLNQPVERGKLRKAARGRSIEAVRRWGKYLIVDFVDGPMSVLVHLGMSGRLRLMKKSEERPRHTHVIFHLTGGGGGRELRYSDPRRFGQVSQLRRGAEREHPSLARLGVDPLLDTLSGDMIHAWTRGSRQRIKTLLLDQSLIAGIGNIYASEALWEARIIPSLRSHRLSRPRAVALSDAVRKVLLHALGRGGTSLRDFVDAHGVAGTNSEYLWVYGREGEPCMRASCRYPIRRTVMQGRATFHCPRCQTR